jgi:hypothetical protein
VEGGDDRGIGEAENSDREYPINAIEIDVGKIFMSDVWTGRKDHETKIRGNQREGQNPGADGISDDQKAIAERFFHG